MTITDKIRIYNEDCLEALKRIPDNAFELAIVDPPYGLGKKTTSGGGKRNSNARFDNHTWDKMVYIPTMSQIEYAWYSKDNLPKLVKIDNTDPNRIHPTQKPVKLYEWLLDNYATEGDRILDTHLGSGSIAIACHNRGYDLTAYEIDKDYFEATTKRIQDHIAQLTLF